MPTARIFREEVRRAYAQTGFNPSVKGYGECLFSRTASPLGVVAYQRLGSTEVSAILFRDPESIARALGLPVNYVKGFTAGSQGFFSDPELVDDPDYKKGVEDGKNVSDLLPSSGR